MSNAIEFLTNLAKQLQEQDNLLTKSPNYCIQEKTLKTGIDPDYTSEIGWFNTDGGWQAKGTVLDQLEDKFNEDGTVPDDWIRTGYALDWEYTGVGFLTYEAANDYVATKHHKHRGEIRVYVDSHYYNREMREVRRLLAGPIQDCLDALKAWQSATNFNERLLAYARADAALDALDTAKEPHQ